MIATFIVDGLYRRGRITKAGLEKAVQDGVITSEQYTAITGEEYQAET